MTSTEKKAGMAERIRKHGENLLRIFPNATEQDPVKLCKKLRRIEAKAHAFALRLCNGPEMSPDLADKISDRIKHEVNKLLGNYTNERVRWAEVPIRINRDPRGYALKIPDKWMNDNNLVLHRDWGGYGILAPDLSND